MKRRTLEDYEKYAGIRYGNRSVQEYTAAYNIPPNPSIEDKEEYENSFVTTFKHCIDIHKSQLTHDDYDFWVVSFESNDGKEIERLDADESEVKGYMNSLTEDNEWIKLWRSYNGKKLDKYVVWPHSKSQGWVDRIEQPI